MHWSFLRFQIALAIVVVVTGCLPALAQTNASIEVSGSVEGATGKHAVYVALWDETGFLKKPAQQIRIPPTATPTFSFKVASGRWALSAFEDMNDNGVLDMGMFGPKEPSGFWRPFHAWRKPRFSDVATQFDKDTANVTVTLRR